MLPGPGVLLSILLAVLADAAVALGGALLSVEVARRHRSALVAFAGGLMLAVAWTRTVPDAARALPVDAVMRGVLGGFALLLCAERLSAHRHFRARATGGPRAWALLLGDAVHNAGDGVAIAAAFLEGPRLGAATALAVVLHELPQETGDFALLVESGLPRARAAALLVLAQSSVLLGAVAGLLARTAVEGALPALLAWSAGGFTYVAAAQLLPVPLDEEGRAWPVVAAFAAGAALPAILDAAG
jgi:zinc and cadmium transporter